MKNQYRIDGDDLIIYLARRDGTVIETVTSAKFFNKLMALNTRWSAKWHPNTNSFYVQTTHYIRGEDGKKKGKNVYLHKYLLDSEPYETVDHINNNSLDNRESNLRIVTNVENSRNRSGANKNNPTGVRNVRLDKKEQKYVVSLWLDGKIKRFGSYEDLELASHVADFVRNKYYGA